MDVTATAPARVPGSAVRSRIVVVGGEHSGADRVRYLLGACPGIHDVGASELFSELAGRPRRWRPWTVVGLSIGRERRMLVRLLNRADGDAAGPSLPLPPPDPRLGRAFTDAVATIDRLALAAGCRNWVEHTPGAPRQVIALERRIPRLRVVHVVRDGRDELAAHCARAQGRTGVRDAAAAVERWNRTVAAHTRCFGRPGHSFVLYEDLVQRPFAELRRLARECGLVLEPQDAAVVDGVELAPPRCERHRLRGLFSPQQRRQLESRLDFERYGRLAERLRQSTLFSADDGPDRPPRPDVALGST